MRRVNLNMKDQQTYEVIKSIVEHGGNKSRASLKLGCSKRSIDRYIAGYKSEGKEYFIHGNRGKQPKHTVDETTKLDVINLYLNKYPNANFAHYTELLEKRENIVVSENWIRTVMSKAEILSPKANRKTKKEAKKKT